MTGLAPRQAAAKLLAAVVEGRTSLAALTDSEHGHPHYRSLDLRDRALVRAMLATALRFRNTLAAMIGERLERPLPANAHALRHILHLGSAQILFLDVPARAAVDLAVTQAKSDPRTRRFAGLVNAVLRGIAGVTPDRLQAVMSATDDAPDWFVESLRAAYGADETAAILAMHRLEAPVDFTVRGDPGGWAETLGGVVLPNGSVRVLRPAAPIADLPGFAEGAWWIQDAAASLPARLLGDVEGSHVADLCAAPGGKTAQLALAGARVTAVEASGSRAKRLAANLARLGQEAELVVADALTYRPDSLFDAVLLDAPCSSSGTVRRHPDVPWTKTLEEVGRLADLQRRLLVAAAGMLRPGGRLVFANCSLFPEEGEAVVADFLAAQPGFVTDPVEPGEVDGVDASIIRDGMLRTTPARWPAGDGALGGADGFFAARMRRIS